jgi:hypothetical protein
MFTQDDLLQGLAECFVPALRRDVVGAGLVRSAAVVLDADAPGAGVPGVPPRYVARVALSAPGSDDAVNAQVRAAVENRLLGLPAISRVELTLQPALFPILNARG